jgi:RNA recognition motif-containing protein
LNEFPGSAILRVHYLELLSSLLEREDNRRQTTTAEEATGDDGKDDIYDETYQQTMKRYQEALDSALFHVGRGSHRNEDGLVARIYRLQAEFLAKTTKPKSAIDEAVLYSFGTRAMTPMRDANSGLSSEYEMFCQDHGIPITVAALKAIEEGRRYEAKFFSSFVTLEDGVDAAMDEEGISSSNQVDLSLDTTLNWDKILQQDNITCWMGFGGQQTTQAFIRYAQACARFRSSNKSQQRTSQEENAMDVDSENEGSNDNDPFRDSEAQIRAMATAVYERGVAECPTVESLWLSFLRHLSYQINQEKTSHSTQLSTLLSKAKSVADRAVRNCPYSVSLFQFKIRIMMMQANAGQIVLDPEEVMKIVTEEALGAQFITSPQATIDLSLTVVNVVRKRILVILATEAGTVIRTKTNKKIKGKKQKDENVETNLLEYDGVEEIKASSLAATSVSKDIDEDALQELEDLSTDLRELYDEIETLMRTKFSKFSEGRARLWKDRAITESILLGPLMASLNFDCNSSAPLEQRVPEVVRCFDKATKVQLPTNPTVFFSYIQSFLGCFPVTSSPLEVIKKLRQTRFLYQKALKTTGRAKHNMNQNADESISGLDYDTAIRSLCHEYMEFERFFGSEHSYSTASKEVERKLGKAVRDARNGQNNFVQRDGTSQFDNPPLVDDEENFEADTVTKRKLEVVDEGDSEEPPKKKSARDPAADDTATEPMDHKPNEIVGVKNLKKPKVEQAKVRVGKLEYPAHPYTVRVSFLSPKTEDMDLVDCFRPRCGTVVHAKIMREKPTHHDHHHKPKSKGWALVQFEEQESVEKALALSGEIGINEKVIKVERSHVAAVGIVPPGMHRVNPRGHGKSTKRNSKQKDHNHEHQKEESEAPDNAQGANSGDGSENSNADKKAPSGDPNDKDEGSSTNSKKPNILAFRPRGVSSTARKPKAKLALSTKTSEK